MDLKSFNFLFQAIFNTSSGSPGLGDFHKTFRTFFFLGWFQVIINDTISPKKTSKNAFLTVYGQTKIFQKETWFH